MRHKMEPRPLLFLLPLVVFFWLTPANAQESAVRHYTGPVIDMHMHAFTIELQGPGAGSGFTNPLTGRSYAAVSSPEEQQRETYNRIEKYNIVKAAVSGSGAVSWHEADPDRVLIGSMVGTRRSSVDGLRSQHGEGKLHILGEMGPYYEGLRADDPAVKPFFDLAEELGIPAAYHLFPGGAPGSLYSGDMMMSRIRAANANPLQFEEVLVTHPTMKIYIMHAGWPYLEDMKALMFAHPQLHAGIAAVNWLLPRAEFHGFLKGLVDAGYGTRVLWGTDQMHMPGVMDDAFAAVDSASFLTAEQTADIFYFNAARFLGLSEAEIAEHWEMN